MKVLRIRIKNLASLEGVTSLNFNEEPLCSAGIFAITGATGAGKSTILDALCLALYAKTPRYLQAKETGIDVQDIGGGSISQSDIRGILRDGTVEGFAEVDFVGVDGQHYRAAWNIRRAKNKAEGSLQAYTVTLKNIDTNTDIAGKKTELLPKIERLVGLNFEQFARSVLLAQGDFTAFLKAPKDEKSSLLEKLTGTQIYSEISQRVFEKHRNEAQELRDLNLQREGIITLTQEELYAFIQQKEAIEKNIPEQEKQVDLLNREINWHTQLYSLRSNLDNANEKYNEAVEAKTNAHIRDQKLKQVERVQPARSLVETKELIEKQLVDKSLAVKDIEATLSGLQKQKAELEELLLTANENLTTRIKARDDAKPLLEEAKVLDVQISERTAQVAHARSEWNTALKNKKHQEGQLKEKQQESDELLAGIDALKKWKEKNNARQTIAENQSLIVAKLDDAQKQLDALQVLSTNIQITTDNIDKQKNEKERLTTASVSIFRELQAMQQGYDKLSEAISSVDFAALEKEKTQIDEMVEDMIRAEAHWKVLLSKLNTFKGINQKLASNKEEVGNTETSLEHATEQISKMQIQQEASLRMLDKARLAAAENVETLRQQLVPGDPCPVCGSEKHPYATHNPQLDHVLSELEADHHTNELAFRESLKKQSSLAQTSTQLKNTIAEQEKEIVSLQLELDPLKAGWARFPLNKNCAEIPDEQKAAWIQEQIIAKRAIQKGIHERIQTGHHDKQQLDKQQQLITTIDRQQNENSNQIKDADRALKSYLEQLGQYNKELVKVTKELFATEKMLTPYFSVTDWFNQWKKDPEQFTQRINAFAIKWKADMQKLDEDSRQHSVLSETLKAMEDRSKILQAELEKKEGSLSVLNNQLTDFNRKRKLIFNGESVSKIEIRLQEDMDVAQQALDKHKGNREALQTTITRTDTQIEQTEKDIAQLQLQLSANIEKIQQWLISDNEKNDSTLDEDELLQLLVLTQEWIGTERAFLRALDDAITEAQSVLNERKASLDGHEKQRMSERQTEELNGLLADAKELLKNSNEQKNKVQFELEQDVANKNKIGTLLETINAKSISVENWAKLNDIIGSADGKKFRQIAQEYTLDVLLSYANIHLEMLSKRYLLQRIPNTLGLQVLDQDMGNEIRTVFSLSGGEFFWYRRRSRWGWLLFLPAVCR